ncbi:MAG: hypothetical protein Crog4KO_22390 [Crocinitomicaceae bacterium]
MENRSKWIFIGYAVLVLLIPAWIIRSSENILSNGKEYKFRVQGRDPFDFFRGNYLTVRIDTRGISTDKSDWISGEKVYLKIATDERGYAYFEEALENPPKKGDYMVSRVVRWWDTGAFWGGGSRERTTVDVEMPNNLNKYFINEEFAMDGEYVLQKFRRASSVHVRVLNGSVRMEDLYIGPTPIMEYLEDGGPIPEEEDEFEMFGF